jgi:PAS domain S-box-containing protein
MEAAASRLGIAPTGEMAALVRAHDWAKTKLGPAHQWTPSLRLAVNLILASGFPMAVRWGPDFVFIYNDGYRPILADKHPSALGLTFREAWPEVQDQLGPLHQSILSGENPGVFNNDLPLTIQRRGAEIEVARFTISYSPLPDATTPTGIGGVLVTAVETTEIRQAEQALRDSEAALRKANQELVNQRETIRLNHLRLAAESERLRRLFEQAPSFMALLNGPDHIFGLANPAYLHLIGNRPVLGQRVRDALPEVENQGFLKLLDQVYATGEPFIGSKVRLQVQHGTSGNVEERFLDFVYQPITGQDGKVTGIFVEGHDVTEMTRAEQALHQLNATLEQQVQERTAELRAQEEALRQSQKMEALGQLTGGVAHDFNNLLQIVIGNLEILGRTLAPEEGRLRRATDSAMNGAKRAATLTQRLLAFSRRQPLQPKLIAVNELVNGMSELLHRSLGETIGVETVLAAGLWKTEVDPNQLESALLNLAVNARDAMPDGGKLTIETANAHIDEGYALVHAEVAVGQYIVVSVSDTGCGMDKEIMSRVLEPFYTTKEPGKGTGLGLSQVYGFVKQSGGHVKLYSEPGHGTTVKIYLPRRYGEDSDIPSESGAAPEGTAQETILLVEDDRDVRAYSAEILRELGYRVIEASDGPSALRMLHSEPNVDLLFTDIVLPGGQTGAQAASEARKLRPGLKVLFTTGYARNAIVHHGRLDAGVQLITKPFTYADLAAKVREVLDTRV